MTHDEGAPERGKAMTDAEYEAFKQTIDPWVREISPKDEGEDEHGYETRISLTMASIGDSWDSRRIMRGATTITRKDVEDIMHPPKSVIIEDSEDSEEE